MPYASIPTKLIREVGTIAYLRVYWGDKECPSCLGGKNAGYHNAQVFLTKSNTHGDWELGGKPGDYPEDRWPTRCDHCGASVPAVKEERTYDSGASNGGYVRQVFRDRLYDTSSGKPEPGTIYVADWYHDPGEKCHDWDNCDGRHLYAVCPDGHAWEMTGRARNCGSPQDRQHRCWVLHEESPGVFHVSKDGHTCSAGGGSIATGDYHGFLHHGVFTAG